MTQPVGTIGGDLDVQNRVGESVQFIRRSTWNQIRRQFHDAVCFGGQAEFVGGTDHPEAFQAPDLGFLDLEITGQHSPHPGKQHGEALAHVGRPAHDLNGFAAAVIHTTQTQPIRIRVVFPVHHAGDHDLGEGLPVFFETFHIEACGCQFCRQFRGCIVPGNVFGEPVKADFQDTPRNWFRKRRSFSYSSLISPMPYLSMAIRSIPMPKANPL